ncbi:XAC0095 family protein [Dyella nitratireducens]|uniref:XAC0095-like domain-containing protein n=1 Tax=Dyella nitratireducens TaxID=1849580 RepID=A0ABQ1GV08_9GAMM|nr:hypothetical protein [Dyella nitratireducens]GGA50839.1 hypothetical protein GCM10010981_45320 [Dyella nitratireducens]GLQ42647.1 hypothetical protein GCM10007902_24970 [Dyella nitratireducens]
MEDNNAEPAHGYLLPEDGFRELSSISVHLRLMAEITYGMTPESENDGRISIRQELMGWFFEQIGMQISDVLGTAKPAVKYVPPLH